MIRIAFDVMGFENKIEHAIIAAEKFIACHPKTQIVLVGDQTQIKSCIHHESPNLSIIDTKEFITMQDTPVVGLRKTMSSMALACKLVKENKADALVSAGNTSCFIPIVYSKLGLIPGVSCVGLMPYIPTIDKVGFNMVDVGANINVSPINLYHYALMANTYVKVCRNISSPTIGLLNIGTEHHKGFEYHKQTNELLQKNKSLNYVGFIEPKGLLQHSVDIAICDGYAGNLVLKALEGSLKTVAGLMKKHYKKPWNWLAAIMSIPLFKTISKSFDYRNNAAAIVLGVNGIAIKTHGSADKVQFFSALKMAHHMVSKRIIDELKKIEYGN